ncbi:MAG: hypothetical protein JEZ04_17655 [Spirochaetales bacterium]|nr:hypothetical protein [Spirochaetales bacterium]
MKKLMPLVLIVLFILAVSGCASNENSIISITLDGAVLIGEPVIDEAAKTITASIEPADLSTITPTFVLSSNAEAGEITLEDGEACICTVTAEDMTSSEWTITVTVQPGASFVYEDTSISFLHGCINSLDGDLNNNYGDGVPYAIDYENEQSSFTGACAYKKVWDYSTEETPTSENMSLQFSNAGIGFFGYIDPTGSENITFFGPGTLDVISFGKIGEYITGTFSGTYEKRVGSDTEPTTTVKITEGFFKVLRLQDNLSTP